MADVRLRPEGLDRINVQNDPVNSIDPFGLRDIFLGVEGDLVGGIGAEGGIGIVIDTDNLKDSGFYVTGGPAAGLNVGIGIGAGVVKEIEGWSYNADINVPILFVSPTVSGDSSGLNGGGLSWGPGIGASVSATYTASYTYSDLQRFYERLLREILRQIFGRDILGEDPCP